MDLRSATAGASWNAFTALICFDSIGIGPNFVGFPEIECADYSYYSAILHELTHLWCARTTRLGWLLSRTAAECFIKWQVDRKTQVSVPNRAQYALGTFVPMLEGLAIYAQLDYEADAPGYPLPSPLTIFPHAFGPGHMTTPLRDCFRITRDMAAFDSDPSSGLETEDLERGQCNDPRRVGLLEMLFLDNSKEDLNYYLVGYLYIKAVQAFFRAKCPAFGDPAIFMPVIIKLIFDQAVLERVFSQPVRPTELVRELTSGVLSLSTFELDAITSMFKGRHNLTNFDLWDFGGQLVSKDWSRPLWYTDTRAPKKFVPIDDDWKPLRKSDTKLVNWYKEWHACRSVWLIGWKRGMLLLTPKNGVVLAGDEGELTIDCGPCAEHFARKPGVEDYAVNQLSDWQGRFMDCLHSCVGQEATIATFVTVTWGVFGVALWARGRFIAFCPFGPWAFQYHNEISTISRGLKIPPESRVAFARAFSPMPGIEKARSDVTAALLGQIVSDPRKRSLLSTQRLKAIGSGAFLSALKDWCGRGSLFDRFSLPAEFHIAAGEFFDFPGFPCVGDGLRINARELFPLLPKHDPRGGR